MFPSLLQFDSRSVRVCIYGRNIPSHFGTLLGVLQGLLHDDVGAGLVMVAAKINVINWRQRQNMAAQLVGDRVPDIEINNFLDAVRSKIRNNTGYSRDTHGIDKICNSLGEYRGKIKDHALIRATEIHIVDKRVRARYRWLKALHQMGRQLL